MGRATQPETVTATVYLVAEPRWRTWLTDDQDRPILEGARIIKATQSRPSVPREGVILKLALEIPAGAFLPLQPEAVIRVSLDDTETIRATARDPREGETDA